MNCQAKHCRDCGREFEDPHDLFNKCEGCQDRDECYRIRAIQDNMEEPEDATETD